MNTPDHAAMPLTNSPRGRGSSKEQRPLSWKQVLSSYERRRTKIAEAYE
jgi:hypothetical protein